MWPFKKKEAPKKVYVTHYPSASTMRQVAKESADIRYKKQVEFWFKKAMDRIRSAAEEGRTTTLVSASGYCVEGSVVNYREDPSIEVLEEVADRLTLALGYTCVIEDIDTALRIPNYGLPRYRDFKVSW